jgi:tetratricopeptide (TPR) repeat protein
LIAHPIVVSDQGSGLVKGCELMGLTHHPDLFHLLRGLAAFGERFYRQALAAIAREYERARVFESGKTAATLKKRMESYEAAKAKADECIRRYDNFCYLWRELRAALDLCDSEGRLPDLASRQAEIEAILELMRALGDAKLNQEVGSFAAGLEGYWGYYQRAEAAYQQVLARYPREVVQVLALGWQWQRQATNSKDYGLRMQLAQEAEFYFAYAASLLPEQLKRYEAIRNEVLEALEAEVRSASLVENVNSSLRPL